MLRQRTNKYPCESSMPQKQSFGDFQTFSGCLTKTTYSFTESVQLSVSSEASHYILAFMWKKGVS